jgi:hypothetical protein
MRLRRLILFLLTPFPAMAQTGAILGTLSDASTKQPLGDVRVTATSPRLEVAQVAVTDGQGAYRIAPLPPGLYVLTFERSSFQPYSRTQLWLRPQFTLRADAELLLEGAVSVAPLPSSTQPTVDPGDCSGDTGHECMTHLTAVRCVSRERAVRTFVPLAELAPRGDVIVYAVSREAAGTVFIVDAVPERAEWMHLSRSVPGPSGAPRASWLPEDVPEP